MRISERKFTAAQGHGFAAERANNLSDVLHGEKAAIIGDNNAKNGADRKILNRDGTTTYIQDKYYSTASGSVNGHSVQHFSWHLESFRHSFCKK